MDTGQRIEGVGIEEFQQGVEEFVADWVDRSGTFFDRTEPAEREAGAVSVGLSSDGWECAGRIVLSFGQGSGWKREGTMEFQADLLDAGPLQIEIVEGRFSMSASALEACLREFEERGMSECG